MYMNITHNTGKYKHHITRFNIQDSRNLFQYHIYIIYTKIIAKNQQKDIKEIAKDQKSPERAIPWETKLHTKNIPWKQKQN